jgi:cell division protein FtsN
MSRRAILLFGTIVVVALLSLAIYLYFSSKKVPKEDKATPPPPRIEEVQPEILPPPMIEEELELPSVSVPTPMETEETYVTDERIEKESPHPSLYPWAVQVFANHSYDRASYLRDELKRKGLPAYQTEVTMEGQRWHRVRLGFYGTKAEAEEIGKKVVSSTRAEDYWAVLPHEKEVRENFAVKLQR